MKCVVALLYITIRKHETCIIFTLSYDLSPLAVSPASVLCDCCFSAYQLRHYCLVSYAIICVIAASWTVVPVESRPAGGNTGYDGVFFWVSAVHSHRWNGRRKRAYVWTNAAVPPPTLHSLRFQGRRRFEDRAPRKSIEYSYIRSEMIHALPPFNY